MENSTDMKLLEDVDAQFTFLAASCFVYAGCRNVFLECKNITDMID